MDEQSVSVLTKDGYYGGCLHNIWQSRLNGFARGMDDTEKRQLFDIIFMTIIGSHVMHKLLFKRFKYLCIYVTI